MNKCGKVKAKELADLVGISVPSIRVRLFQLMAMGLVGQEKTRDHHVWFFVKASETPYIQQTRKLLRVSEAALERTLGFDSEGGGPP